MKKILGLLALTVAVAGTANASQDFLKTISADAHVRYRYQDRQVNANDNKSNEIGNEGFKTKNRDRVRFYKSVSGTVVLHDELGLEADFGVTQYTQSFRGVDASKGVYAENTTKVKSNYTKPTLTLRKGFKLGNIDATGKFSFVNETWRKDSKTTGILNTYTLGADFDTKVLGQTVSVGTGLVYADGNHGKLGDYALASSAKLTDSRNDQWGINLDLGNSGTIAKGNWGTVTYGLSFEHKFRELRGTVLRNGKLENPGSNVYLYYAQNVKYATPTYFGGLSAYVQALNEWERHTIKQGWDNTFSLILGTGYKAGFQTSVGKVTVNPYVSYSVLNRGTNYDRTRTENKRLTTEFNNLRAGLKVTLEVK